MNIEVTTTVTISINGIDEIITVDEAKELRDALNIEFPTEKLTTTLPYYPPGMRDCWGSPSPWYPNVTPSDVSYSISTPQGPQKR